MRFRFVQSTIQLLLYTLKDPGYACQQWWWQHCGPNRGLTFDAAGRQFALWQGRPTLSGHDGSHVIAHRDCHPGQALHEKASLGTQPREEALVFLVEQILRGERAAMDAQGQVLGVPFSSSACRIPATAGLLEPPWSPEQLRRLATIEFVTDCQKILWQQNYDKLRDQLFCPPFSALFCQGFFTDCMLPNLEEWGIPLAQSRAVIERIPFRERSEASFQVAIWAILEESSGADDLAALFPQSHDYFNYAVWCNHFSGLLGLWSLYEVLVCQAHYPQTDAGWLAQYLEDELQAGAIELFSPAELEWYMTKGLLIQEQLQLYGCHWTSSTFRERVPLTAFMVPSRRVDRAVERGWFADFFQGRVDGR